MKPQIFIPAATALILLALSAATFRKEGNQPSKETIQPAAAHSTNTIIEASRAGLPSMPSKENSEKRILGQQSANPSYTLFESGQVRPLALSSDKKTLFALNTPDNRLEVFDVRGEVPLLRGAVAVGLEPVALAVRSDEEVWVVNHLSDSVSIVRLRPEGRISFRARRDARPGRVVKTLLVGDEPRDIVFAGEDRRMAFVTAAHRGQNAPFDPQLTTPGIGRADVWVFDSSNLGDSLTGDPVAILNLFTDTPRALAASPDGSRVYAAGFLTGNRSTAIHEGLVEDNGGLPQPTINADGDPQPSTGLIVQFDGQHWMDDAGRSWDAMVPFSLPDRDVFVIDALTEPPRLLEGQDGFYAGVGTAIFNMAVNPVSGRVYVSNTEAFNRKRFEGPGEFAGDTVRGRLHESRITVLDEAVRPRHLNKHIDYSSCCAPLPNVENSRSLAFPTDMQLSADGRTLYVAAFGSSKVGVFDTVELEDDTFTPSQSNHIPLQGGGPSGLALDEERQRLYVLTRFDNSLAVVNTVSRQEIFRQALYSPEPESIVAGRRFLYDAALTSSHGDSACASCHVFGDFDGLAWDLGDPDTSQEFIPGPFLIPPLLLGQLQFASLKGPMTTQSLRGMANHGPMHWRGDRTGGLEEFSAQPDQGSFDEQAAFRAFNPAFEGLIGRHERLSPQQMQSFTEFILQIRYPPNPIRNLDNSLTADQQAGRDFYFNSRPSDTFGTCNRCHVLDPQGNAGFGVDQPGFFGSDGRYTFDGVPQIFKVPHLRNMYQKVGMFGMLPDPFQGDQVRGFGFLHDGSVDTVFRFFSSEVFSRSIINPGGFPDGEAGAAMRRQVEAFMMAFPSNLAPIVGQQVTVDSANQQVTSDRLALLMARAEDGECDLVAKGRQGLFEAGFLYQGNGLFETDQAGQDAMELAALLEAAASAAGEVTFTCAPPGSGRRMGVDRDEDGVLDGDEVRQKQRQP